MGFTVTPLAQKARTATLIADSDLNLGNYDLIATDVKGDTAEFTEFVGGVGNFSNVLGSGNLDIEGTGNIKGLTTFQNAVQVNGSLHVEGSINNVNIADNGEITTAQGVNGADFNGAKITSTKFNGATIDTSGNVTGVKGTFSGAVTGTSFNGVALKTPITVTPSSNWFKIYPEGTSTAYNGLVFTILPLNNGILYSGSIQVKGSNAGYSSVDAITNSNTVTNLLTTYNDSATTVTFTNIRALYFTRDRVFGNADIFTVPIYS